MSDQSDKQRPVDGNRVLEIRHRVTMTREELDALVNSGASLIGVGPDACIVIKSTSDNKQAPA